MNKSAFEVHKKVKKKEMLFEYILLALLFLMLAYLIIHAFNLWPAITTNVNLASVGGVFISLYALVWQLYSAIKAKRVIVSLGLKTTVTGNDVLISASVTNVGTKSIYPLLTNIYISEGIPDNNDDVKSFRFEPITVHPISSLGGKEQCFDCPAAKHCKAEALSALRDSREIGVVSYPDLQGKNTAADEFRNTVRYAYNLKLLSYQSLIHIMPKETFSEETVVQLPKPGYYRIFMIYTDKEWKDCICSSSMIKIEQDGREKKRTNTIIRRKSKS